jgi:hypothetical protein
MSRDGWGCVWNTSMPGITGTVREHLLASWDDFQHFKPADPEVTDESPFRIGLWLKRC